MSGLQHGALEVLTFQVCAATILLWAAVSIFVVFNRIRFDRRRRRLADIARAIADPAAAGLPALDRSPAVRRILSRLSRRRVYQMVATPELPLWLTEVCATYSLEYLGLRQMVRDASAHSGRTRWRRTSALFALGHMRADGIHELLASAIADSDAEVAGAAATVLHRLGDRRAAEILVSALRGAALQPSRVATHLDELPIPIDDLLRPLLRDENPTVRYWAASLLCRPGDAPGLVEDLSAITDDPEAPVRKAALTSLGSIGGMRALPIERAALDDAVGYVRSTAVRAIGHQGSLADDDTFRRQLASWIAPLLADNEWEVRNATKEALTRLGRAVWREVAAHLESTDGFARDGAAEVLQDLDALEWAVAIPGGGTAVRGFRSVGRPS